MRRVESKPYISSHFQLPERIKEIKNEKKENSTLPVFVQQDWCFVLQEWGVDKFYVKNIFPGEL